MSKTKTDLFWNDRALHENDIKAVNIADFAQRQLETEFLIKHVKKEDYLLEAGCGNGYLTNQLRQHVNHVDAFDYSEHMIQSAMANFGETNNHFFCNNLLQPDIDKVYDSIVCVRVLINLKNLDEQIQALDNLKKVLKKGGRLILIEGYIDGFNAINQLREQISLPTLTPAKINFYSEYSDVHKHLIKDYDIGSKFHTGCFDLLTRVVYPSLVGHENAQGYSAFHESILDVARHYNPESMQNLARVKGLCLIKK